MVGGGLFGSVLSRDKKEERNKLKRVKKKEGRKRGRTEEEGEESQQKDGRFPYLLWATELEDVV